MRVQIFTRNFLGGVQGFDVRGMQPVGGAEVYVRDLARMIRRLLGFQVEIFQIGTQRETLRERDFTVRMEPITSRVGRLLFPYSLGRIFARLEDPDALKIYNDARYAAFRRTGRGPAIGITHGVEWDTRLVPYVAREVRYRSEGTRVGRLTRGIGKYAYFSWIVPVLMRKGISRLDHTVSVDHHTLQYVPTDQARKVVVIPNHVDLVRFHPCVPPVTITPRTNMILVARNLNVARGVYLIPEVARALRKHRSDFKFWITGTGPLAPYLSRKISEDDLNDEVRLLGHIPHADLPAYYTASSVVLIPSIFSEGTSFAALEAMACGRPVLMTDVGGLREIGENGVSKIVIPADPVQIARTIDALLDDAAAMKSIGDAAREYVSQHHSKEAWERKWAQIIQGVS